MKTSREVRLGSASGGPGGPQKKSEENGRTTHKKEFSKGTIGCERLETAKNAGVKELSAKKSRTTSRVTKEKSSKKMRERTRRKELVVQHLPSP